MAIKNPELVPLFKEVKQMLAPYAAHFAIREPELGRYELWTTREVSVLGRKPEQFYFVGLMIQKAFVGFYFMPLFLDPELSARLDPELLRLLNGKTCFRLKALTPALASQIDSALLVGLEYFRANNWV